MIRSKQKYYSLILLVFLGIFLLIRAWNPSGTRENTSAPSKQEYRPKDKSGFENKLNRHEKRIIITKHARCRMECRHVSLQEVREILEQGEIDFKRSVEKPGPEYALEGISSDKQHLRIVVAPKDNGLVLITCIDLDQDWPCTCN